MVSEQAEVPLPSYDQLDREERGSLASSSDGNSQHGSDDGSGQVRVKSSELPPSYLDVLQMEKEVEKAGKAEEGSGGEGSSRREESAAGARRTENGT